VALFSSPNHYLSILFVELERLKPRESYYLSHALTYHKGELCALISRDARERIMLQELDADPVKAAKQIFLLWQSRTDREGEAEFE
jgi:hypothetical protein